MRHQVIPTTIRPPKDPNRPPPREGLFLIERRKHPRISVELPFDYSLLEREGSFRGITEDASEGGLLVYLHEKIEIGTLLKIEMLFSKGTELTTIQAMVTVVWSDLVPKESWAEYQYGVQFQSFFKGDLNRLKILLREIGQAYG